MTNKEIDKLLSMLDRKDLLSMKKFLLSEKEKKDNQFRQSTFEEYLRTNKFGFNLKTTPKLYSDNNIQKFMNGASLYIINKNFFRTQTPKLIKGSARGAKANHRFEYVSEEFFQKYIENILLNFSDIFTECTDYVQAREHDNYTLVKYYNNITKNKCIEKFDRKETDWADIILNHPTYYISHNFPILKAESEIGKCYILGYKKN